MMEFALPISILYLAITFILAALIFILIKRESEIKRTEKELHQKSLHLLNETKHQTEKIMEKALNNAQEIVSDATSFKHKIDYDLAISSELAVDKHVQILESHLKQSMHLYDEKLNKVFENIYSELDKLKSNIKTEDAKLQSIISKKLESQALAAESIMSQTINLELGKAKEEIDAYKKSRIENIQKEIEEKVNAIAKKVVIELIPEEEQEKKVLEAIRDAEKKGFFKPLDMDMN